MNSSVHIEVHDDGSFDLVAGIVRIRNAFPGIDAAPIRPLRVSRTDDDDTVLLRYELGAGRTLVLRFRTVADTVRVQCRLGGFDRAPHWVSPVFDGEITGVTGLFRTGIGFSGPTNFIDLSRQPAEYSFESYLVTGLAGADDGVLAFGAFEHADYLAKAHISNRYYRHNFRNRETERNLVRLEILFATECIAPAAGILDLPEIVFTAGTGLWPTLRGWTELLARERQIRPRLDPRYHFCSWYERGPNFGQVELDRLLDGLARRPEPLTCIQLDAGYFPSLGDWLTTRTEVWPHGLAHAFDRIRAAGHVPGIWVGPFMVGSRSRLAAEHPDWILKDLTGRPLAKWKRYDGGGTPAHTDEETYVLDTSHPEALDYITEVFRTLHRWGARFFKTDFIEWGFIDSTQVRRAGPGRTSAQYYHEVMQRIRGAIGDSYWLGCIAYFAPMIGWCDGMRVSADVGVKWEGAGGTGNDGVGGGTPNAIEETHGCHFFHNVLWQNDPDVTFFRERHLEFSQLEIESLACWNGILGVSVNTSDEIPALPEHRHRLWRFVRPQQTPSTARIVGWPRRGPCHVVTRSYPEQDAHALLVFNTGEQPVRECVCLADVFAFERATVFTWGWQGAQLLGSQTVLIMELQPHESRLFYISPGGEPPPVGLTLGGRLND